MILYDYQKTAVEKILASPSKRQLITMPTGCVSGDTLIGINRAGKGKSISIKDAFLSQNHHLYRHDIPTQVRVMKENFIGLHEIIGIKESGLKETFRLSLANGKTIRATKDHEILTNLGFKPLGTLSSEDLVICSAEQVLFEKDRFLEESQVLSIDLPMMEETYDIACHDPYHNFVANGIVVHNCGKTITFLAAIKSLALKTLVIAHRNELIRQTIDKAIKVGFDEKDLGEFSFARKDLDHQIVVGSIQTAIRNIPKLEEAQFECLVIDECFVSGTIIDQNTPIENLKIGDMVQSFNEKSGFIENRKVLRLFKKRPFSLVKLKMRDGKEIICTPNHPFMTQENVWKKAIDLKGSVVLGFTHLLQDRHSKPNFKNSDRSRRLIPFQPKRSGSKKRGFFIFTIVDSVEILEQTSDGTFGGNCPDGFVYNFEVEGTHTYLANNFVVHNCHHASSPTYQDLIYQLGFADGSKYLLGFTATPVRGDHLSIMDTFKEWTYALSLEEAVRKGYISDIRGLRINMKTDLKSIRSSQGDYTIKDLELSMNTPDKNEIIGKTVSEHAIDKKSIAFCVTVQHARDLCEALTLVDGIHPALITGDMNMQEREEVYESFRKGSINVLCSCMVLTEGFDVPDVSCILMARPTRSSLLYRQMVGRGLRKFPGKTSCLVIEFTSNDKKMLSLEDISPEKKIANIRNGESFLEALDSEEQEKEKREQEIYRVYAVEVEMYDPLDRTNKPIFISEPLGEGFFYIPHRFGFFYGGPKDHKLSVREFSKCDKTFNELPTERLYDSYDNAIESIQNMMHSRNIRKFLPLDGDYITEKQAELLRKQNIPFEGISKREASKRIERLFIVRFLNKHEKKKFATFEE